MPENYRNQDPKREEILVKYDSSTRYITKNVKSFLQYRDGMRPNPSILPKGRVDMSKFVLVEFHDSLVVNPVDATNASLSDLTSSIDFTLQRYSSGNDIVFGTPVSLEVELRKTNSVRVFNPILGIYCPREVIFLAYFERKDNYTPKPKRDWGFDKPIKLGFGF